MRMSIVPRRMVFASGTWMVVLAVVTLVPYLLWFRSTGTSLLESGSAESTALLISETSAVIGIYGSVLLIAGFVTVWMAWRRPMPWSGAPVAWLVACGAGAVLTRDVIGAILLMVTVALVVAQRRALARAASVRASAA